MRHVLIVLLLPLLGATGPAAADVYRWTDARGVIHYTDQPPAKDAKPVELPKLQTYRAAPAGAAAAPAPASEQDEPLAAAAPLRIASPQPDETIRDVEGRIPVALAATLQPGEGLIYLLDGQPQSAEPTQALGTVFSGVERGQHEIGVILLGADGRERGRAKPVTVFLMPSVIRKH